MMQMKSKGKPQSPWKAVLACVFFVGIAAAPAQAGLLDGPIAVYEGNNLSGYVSDTYNNQNTFTYTTNIADALNIEINSSASTLAGRMLNPPGANLYFGAVGGSGGYYFGPGQIGYAYLSGTSLVPANSPPSSTATNDLQPLGYNAPSESTIWSFSGSQMMAQWTNSDGTQNPTVTAYDPFTNSFIITGDLNAFNHNFGDNAVAVTFQFEGTPVAVPEPSSLLLMGVGAICMLAYRLRQSRRHAETLT
jgi:hypothetical protein